jgi:hypothetical protein
MFGSIGIPELLVVLVIVLILAAPIALLAFLIAFIHRRSLTQIRAENDELRRRVEALERRNT